MEGDRSWVCSSATPLQGSRGWWAGEAVSSIMRTDAPQVDTHEMSRPPSGGSMRSRQVHAVVHGAGLPHDHLGEHHRIPDDPLLCGRCHDRIR